jgi:hypothetical protein
MPLITFTCHLTRHDVKMFSFLSQRSATCRRCPVNITLFLNDSYTSGAALKERNTLYSPFNNKTTQVWFMREQKHMSDGLWPRKSPNPRTQVEGVSRPKTITRVFLLPPKSHLYLSYATKSNENKLLILELHMPSSP